MALSHTGSFDQPWRNLAARIQTAQGEPGNARAERWECSSCGRAFSSATTCCAHEEQCGGLTRC
jgi:hypothetical protein